MYMFLDSERFLILAQRATQDWSILKAAAWNVAGKRDTITISSREFKSWRNNINTRCAWVEEDDISFSFKLFKLSSASSLEKIGISACQQIGGNIDGVNGYIGPIHSRLNGRVDAQQTLNRGTRTLISRNERGDNCFILRISSISRFNVYVSGRYRPISGNAQFRGFAISS